MKVLPLLCLALCSCTPSDDHQIQLRLAALEQKQREHGNELTNIVDLQARVFILEVERDSYVQKAKAITLSPEDKGFQQLDTDIGPLLVSCQSVEPYLDGYKVRLDLGNPWIAAYNSVKLTAVWGPKFQNLKYAEWAQRQRTNETHAVRTIKPGTWTPAEIIIAPAGPDELRNVRLSAEVKQIFLNSSPDARTK